MNRADPATTRKALEFAHELAKHGVEFVVIPIVSEQQRNELITALAYALKEFETEYAKS